MPLGDAPDEAQQRTVMAAFERLVFVGSERERVDQHLCIGIRALERLCRQGVDQLHSRKLHGFAEVAFQ